MQGEINFYSEETDFELSNETVIHDWLQTVAAKENKGIDTLTFIFCSDDYLYEMNVEHLQHDTLTDVITFPYSDEGAHEIEGDIFISIDRVKENAATFGVTMLQELHRVMVHGTLHLLGYGDKTPEDKALMTEKENFYLALLS
jgi:probable rRNA maturation factor